MRPIRLFFTVAGLAVAASGCDMSRLPTASIGGAPDLSAGNEVGMPEGDGFGFHPGESLGNGPDPLVPSCTATPGGSVTRTVGRQGGLIVLGPDTLLIPPGALRRPTSITASRPDQSPLPVIMLQPVGLRFHKPAVLTMGYAQCDIRALGRLTIVEVNDHLKVIRKLKSAVDRLEKSVTADLGYVSNYAIAY